MPVAKKESTLDTMKKLDIGFRVFKVDSPNHKDSYYSPADTTQEMLFDFESNIKPDRTDLDLFWGCILDAGLMLSLPYKVEKIDGVTVFNYNDGDLVGVFEKVNGNVIKFIAESKPKRLVLRDDCLSSWAKIHIIRIFEEVSPYTKLKVI